MKILLITPTYFPIMGGAEIGIYEIYRRLIKRHKVKILTPWLDNKLISDYGIEEPFIDFSDKDILRFKDKINLMNLPGHRKLKGIIPPYSLSSIQAALKIVRLFKPDIVNVYYVLPTGLAALLVERITRTPVVISIIGRDVPGPNIPPMWKIYARRVARLVSRKVFISQYCRQALFGSDSDYGEIVPFGVDVKKFRPDLDGSKLRDSFKIPRNSKILFSLQRLDQWKRVDVIIEAMKFVLKRKDVFLVIGGKGPEQESLLQITRELGLTSRIIFAGYIRENDLPLYYAMSDIFVFHSTYETFGLVLLQAMAAGKPIVSVNCTAIPELVENNQNGILVDPLNPEEFASAVISLLNNKKSMKCFSAESRRRALIEYDWDHIAEKYEAIFYRCLK